ncbi:hypothetical protein AX16_008867 [Volvariella volvacea WC 439]|nr:hypothetical protein AX16_008867 [Volvariella volvacea WC 439]
MRTSAFKQRKQAIYEANRKGAKEVSTAGISQLEGALAKFRDLRRKETPVAGLVQDLEAMLTNSQTCLDELLDEYPNVFQNLSLRRAQQVNSTSEMLEANPTKRHQSLKTILRDARVQVETVRQNEKASSPQRQKNTISNAISGCDRCLRTY